MNDLPRQKLREIVARHGQSVGGDARRSEGLLRDYCGEYRREVSVLVMAVAERVPTDLLGASPGTAREVLLARLARRLCDNLALSEDAARWAVISWALALGVVSEDELKSLEQRSQRPAQAEAPPPPVEVKPPQVNTSTTADIVVSAGGGGDYFSIGDALRSAAPGSRLLVRAGLYEEGIKMDKEIEIVGDGPPEKIIVSGRAASCVEMRAGRARVAGLTLRGSGEGFFAVDVVQGRLLLEDCDVTSESLSCVAVHGTSAEPLIRRCRIHGGADSGLYFFDGAAGTLEECEVYANANVGVAIKGRAHAVVRRSRIYGGENAGVVVWEHATGLLEECEIYGNRLTGVGVSDGGKLTARACRIYDGENSGVLIHRGGDGTLEKCDIHGHREAQVAVESRGQLTALQCGVHEGHGSGVFVREGGKALLQECAVTNNADAGVSIIGADSLAAVIGCRVKNNGHVGVRIAEGGAARVVDSDLSGNQLGAWDAEEGAFVEGGNNREE